MAKFFFKLFLSVHIFIYRASKGRMGSRVAGLPILLLTTTGRKTGKQRTTPLGMLQDESNYVVVASANGADQNPGWYHNLQSNPLVTMQINDHIMTAKASTATAATRDRLRIKLLELAPRYAAYEKRTTREIPLVILQPIKGE